MRLKASVILVALLFLFPACGSKSNSIVSKVIESSNNQVNGPVRGNKESHIYHWQGCPEYDRIAPEHIVEFRSATEAEQAGYRPALNCPKGDGQTAAAPGPTLQPRPSEPGSAPTRPVSTTREKTKKTETPVETNPREVKQPETKRPETKPTDTSEGKPTVKVWVSKDSSVYHCPDSALYGKTKTGEYMTQRAALKKGLKPDGNKVCQ
ncbi:MAG TPA: hypothetical protein VEV42_10980 [Pyrinomonadaceae bacterium]|nr:hypothetical protein [Pyrinomonadaceae bacterium]